MEHWVKEILGDALWDAPSMPSYVKDGIDRIINLVEKSDVHVFRTAELERLGECLDECTELSELSELMWRITIAAGFQNFVIFVLKQGPGVRCSTRICSSCKDEWLAVYQEKKYQYIDPVIARAVAHDGTFLFSELSESAPAVRAFWDNAEEMGIGRNGVCFAMTRRDASRIGVSFLTSNTKEKTNELARLNGSDLEFLALIAADSFSYITFGPNFDEDALSDEELRFLYLLVSNSNPEDAMKVSARFGSNNTLQASIRMKLGVESVFQAVAIAASKGWFNHLSYDKSEVFKPFPSLTGL